MLTPLAPFDSWPRQYLDPNLGFVWFIAPRWIVLQAAFEVATAAHVMHALDLVDTALAHARAERTIGDGLWIVHDWRTIREFPPEARKAFVARSRRRGRGEIARAWMCVFVGPVKRATFDTAALIVGLATGADIRFIADPHQVILHEGLRPPHAGVPFPGLAAV